ncbi:hypothetical protein BN2476_300122 [Paraburkholderia piptadeniae]|uniref:Uncharacterized protein n=1 Tax=Paraburkholderia piptadeniae TaxID=1701573 RepID=A0A1N7S2W4_9BURK|nr:hypothetical protein [Paraburkholderia piptadeniae]SIT41676.1 hypothetical protein BN2476_300122 [Paraburkholderia piptadeniae]
MWRSHVAVRDVSGDKLLWYGAVYREEFYRPAHLVTIAKTQYVAIPSMITTLLGLQQQTVIRSANMHGALRYAILIWPVSAQQQGLSVQ